ncbi:hypothetical protein [Consotaella aegiceratis]|uniref:hypothetical protein n=1 Tax=Consotaella aegiceratis TaxID=3097961 RepID=UPI002F3F10C1
MSPTSKPHLSALGPVAGHVASWAAPLMFWRSAGCGYAEAGASQTPGHSDGIIPAVWPDPAGKPKLGGDAVPGPAKPVSH